MIRKVVTYAVGIGIAVAVFEASGHSWPSLIGSAAALAVAYVFDMADSESPAPIENVDAEIQETREDAW
jgi:hypothetical protein